MAEKYVVTQEFIDTLNELADGEGLSASEYRPNSYIDGSDILSFDAVISDWWYAVGSGIERNNRLIAIVRWLNGEDVFEVEKKQWVVRSKTSDNLLKYLHLHFFEKGGVKTPVYDMYWGNVEKFDNREEAEKWVVPGFEVVEF